MGLFAKRYLYCPSVSMLMSLWLWLSLSVWCMWCFLLGNDVFFFFVLFFRLLSRRNTLLCFFLSFILVVVFVPFYKSFYCFCSASSSSSSSSLVVSSPFFNLCLFQRYKMEWFFYCLFVCLSSLFLFLSSSLLWMYHSFWIGQKIYVVMIRTMREQHGMMALDC